VLDLQACDPMPGYFSHISDCSYKVPSYSHLPQTLKFREIID
jgi:hypothetical protein